MVGAGVYLLALGPGRTDRPTGWLCLADSGCRFPFSIQAPILYRLADVCRIQLLGSGQIGDRPGNLEYPVIRPRGQSQPPHRLPEDRFDRLTQPAVSPEIAGAHVRVGMDTGLRPKALPLEGPRAPPRSATENGPWK